MKEPGLDNRHRDKQPPKAGEIQQKRGDTLNKNLSKPIPQVLPECEAKYDEEIGRENQRRGRATSREETQAKQLMGRAAAADPHR